MITTLIPFLLAARLESPDILPWNGGTEVTYLVQNHATTLHSDNSNCTNMIFHLQTMLSCQNMNSSLFCHFHNTSVHSSLAGVKQPRPLPKYIMDDIWTKKVLQQDSIEIAYEKSGEAVVWVPIEVEPIARDMMMTLARLLIVGVDMSSKLTGSFETASNATIGRCKSKLFITRSLAPSRQKSSIMNLFLIPQSNESLERPLEIDTKMVDHECTDKPNFYSFFGTREIRKMNLQDIETQLNSAENFIIIDNHNFTSYSKVKLSINNHRDNTKYVVDESISVTLQKISVIECPHCNDDDNSNSDED